MKAFVIGGATLDTIIEYEDMESMTHQGEDFRKSYLLLGEGAKIEVKSQKVFSGGGATNTAVAFRKLGMDVTLFCKMAKDSAGEAILSELKSFGINTDEIRYSQTEGTANSYVVPSLSGDRTLFAYRGANTTLLNEDVPADAMKDADFIYITSLSQASAEKLPNIVETAKSLNVPVAVNPGISQLKSGCSYLRKALSGIDILITNYEEAEAFTYSLSEGCMVDQNTQGGLLNGTRFALRNYFDMILEMGPKVVVVTNGGDGVYVSTKDEILFHEIKKSKIVNTLGAGDAFGSSFVGCYYMGDGLAEAIRAGIVNSASVIGHPDAKSGLLTRDEIAAEIKNIPATMLEKRK